MKKSGMLIFALILTACLLPMAIADQAGEETFVCGDWEYVLLEDGTAKITKYTGYDQILSIPDTLDGRMVTVLGRRSFSVNHSPAELYIPDNVISIETNPFGECGNLETITVSPGHPTLETIDGVLFSKPDRCLICYHQNIANSVYKVPADTRIIGDEAFFNNQSLTEIKIPDSVNYLGDCAFTGCISLTGIMIPDSVTTVGANPFAICDSLKEIIVSQDHPVLEVVDGVLFSKPDHRLICCPGTLDLSAYDIPQGTVVIGARAFENCYSLSAVTIPESVTDVMDCAFLTCISLTEINLPSGVKWVGDYAFFNCRALPGLTLPVGLEHIGKDAFMRCDTLTVTVSAGSYAEQYCKENDIPFHVAD